MNRKYRVYQSLILIVVAALSSSAFAARAAFNADVVRVLSDSENYGGCMALLSVRPADRGLDCWGSWVTFSCSGDFSDRASAIRKFEMAQVALLTDNQIFVVVDDTKKHNNYCFAPRVDLLNQ
jgi:hypothetical protein